MKQEKPVKIIKHGGKHKTETRVFQREIWESFCVQADCKFKGKHAAQGICHTRQESVDQRYIDRVFKRASDWLKESKRLRKLNKQLSDKAWIAYLEGSFISDKMNAEFTWHELLALRTENAKLRLAVGKYK
jgi:hypothetical protein